MLFLDNTIPMHVEYFNVTLVDDTGLVLPRPFPKKFPTSALVTHIMGVVIVDMKSPSTIIDTLTYSVAEATIGSDKFDQITVTASTVGAVTINVKLAVLYRI